MSRYKKFDKILIIIWPYIFFFPYTFDIIAVGNDFDLIYYSYKRYIAEMLSAGIIPLWDPTTGAGFSLIFNPFAQYFYIPGWINYLIHIVSNNLSLYSYVIYTIFSFSIFSLGIFNWLRSLKIDYSIALLSSLIIICNLKVGELIRFPNAAHAAAWFPWILYGINLINEKKIQKGNIIIFFSNLFLLTAGYPYFIIYSVFLLIPYSLFVPFISSNLKKIIKDCTFFFIYLKNLFFSFGLSYLIALPWLLEVRTFTKNLVDRTEKNWDFATEHTFYWKDTIGSWLYPPSSSTEGWYYSGIVITLITITCLLSSRFFKNKLICFSLIFIILISYFSWGKHSYLFEFFWNYVPLIDSLRTWPRINIIIVPFIYLIFSICLQNLLINFKFEKSLSLNKNYIKNAIFIFLILFIIQFYFYYSDFYNKEYWGYWQKLRFDELKTVDILFFKQYVNLYDGEIYLIFNFISFICFFIFLKKKNIITNSKNFFLSIFLLVIFEVFLLSNFQWGLKNWKSSISVENEPLKKLQDAFISSNIIQTVKGNQYFRDNRRFNINYPDNYGYNNHAKNFMNYFERYNGEIRKNILKEDIELVYQFYGVSIHPDKFFISSSINYNDIVLFMKDANSFVASNDFRKNILIEKYDGNTVELEIFVSKPGWLSFINNWDKHWKAELNGKKTTIYKLLGSYQSIKVDKGYSKIKFQYKPW